MVFKKNHKQGFTSENPLDKTPVCLKVNEGVRAKLLKVPHWQEKLRIFIDDLIEKNSTG
jgi:hypothetical protein